MRNTIDLILDPDIRKAVQAMTVKQQAYDSVNTLIEAHKKRLQARLPTNERKAPESMNTYQATYY